jgi:hypothetical protein
MLGGTDSSILVVSGGIPAAGGPVLRTAKQPLRSVM